MELSRSYKRPWAPNWEGMVSSCLLQRGNGASVKTGMEKGKGAHLGKETEHSLEKTS